MEFLSSSSPFRPNTTREDAGQYEESHLLDWHSHAAHDNEARDSPTEHRGGKPSDNCSE
jgi:hypothetical protein